MWERLRNGKLSFRSVIVLWVSAILYVVLFFAGLFFTRIYSTEKISSAYELELHSASQFASNLGSLLLSIGDRDPELIRQSNEIFFVKENGCEAGGPVVISDVLKKALDFAGFSVDAITADENWRNACSRFATTKSRFLLFQGKQKSPIPYALALIATKTVPRLVAISMDGLGGTYATGIEELIDPAGTVAWLSAEPDYLRSAKVDATEVEKVARRAVSTNLPGLLDSGEDTFASYAPFVDGWTVFSFGSRSQILSTVRSLEYQLGWLLLGASFLVVLFARKVTQRLTSTLTDLIRAAKSLGDGDFGTRVVVHGHEEFQILQGTFNRMAGELNRLVDLARESSKLEAEVDLAQKVQQILIPANTVKSPRHILRSFYRTAAQCGGDWWGFIEAKDGREVLLIGDVTGHGVPAAFLTAAAKGCCTVIEKWIEQDSNLIEDPRRLLELFNRAILESSGGAMTMSFQICVLDPREKTITLSNAGHNWAYLLIPDPSKPGGGTLKAVGGASPILGASRDEKFNHIEVHPWLPGSKLVIYTDGLIDCFKGDENLFDKRDFVRILKASLKNDAASLLADIIRERENRIHGLPPADDVTLVVCQQEGGV